jgi:hypothetical protein
VDVRGGFRFSRPAPKNAVQAHLWRTVPEGLLGETAARDAICEQAAGTGTLGDRPLVVLSAGAPLTGRGREGLGRVE